MKYYPWPKGFCHLILILCCNPAFILFVSTAVRLLYYQFIASLSWCSMCSVVIRLGEWLHLSKLQAGCWRTSEDFTLQSHFPDYEIISSTVPQLLSQLLKYVDNTTLLILHWGGTCCTSMWGNGRWCWTVSYFNHAADKNKIGTSNSEILDYWSWQCNQNKSLTEDEMSMRTMKRHFPAIICHHNALS